jgi:hypothetical protein
VRNAGLIIVSLLLSACASRLGVSCAEEFRADSPAIQGRVFAFHPDVHPVNVVRCAAVATRSGFSIDPDEEACLVEVAPDSVPQYAAPSSRLHPPPEVVSKLAPDLPEKTYAVALNEGGAAVYRTLEVNHVVLYAPHVRCSTREEVK